MASFSFVLCCCSSVCTMAAPPTISKGKHNWLAHTYGHNMVPRISHSDAHMCWCSLKAESILNTQNVILTGWCIADVHIYIHVNVFIFFVLTCISVDYIFIDTVRCLGPHFCCVWIKTPFGLLIRMRIF